MISKSTQINAGITRFRRLSIGSAILIAFIASAMIFFITSALDDAAATKINIASQQRMLSQTTLTNAIAINAAAHADNWSALEPSLRNLNQTISELAKNHNTLLSYRSKSSITEQNAYQAIELPFASLIRSGSELNKLTLSMVRRAPYLDEKTLTRVAAAKDEIKDAHAIYLPQMEIIINEYEQQHTSEVKRSIKNSKFGMLVLFVILVATILFIIEPAILLIRRQLSELEYSNRKVQQAEGIRSRLLTNIGHEFRTPMNAIMGFSDILSEDDLTDSERLRLVKSIFDSSSDLTALIETMLDVSAAQSGQLRITAKQCDIYNLLSTLKDKTASKAQTKSIVFDMVMDEECPQIITTDPNRLAQILTLIADNAIKFTEEGCVNIQTKLIQKSSKHFLEFKISDTGIGISPNHIKSIFDPFQQAEDSLTRDFGGAGLGLSISRDIARALGGDITVTSTQQQGSTFTITIDPGEIETMKIEAPKEQTQETTAPTTSEPPKVFDLYKILIVDDAKDNRMLLKHILKKTGAKLELAVNGKQALELVDIAIQSETPFDLILMDMRMPVMDGYTATTNLRENKITIPVIAVTAHALQGDREHCLDAGCNEYLTKPIKKSLLIETSLRLIEEHASQSSETAEAA